METKENGRKKAETEVRLRVGVRSGQERSGKSGDKKLIGPPVPLERGGEDRRGFDGRLKRALRAELEHAIEALGMSLPEQLRTKRRLTRQAG